MHNLKCICLCRYIAIAIGSCLVNMQTHGWLASYMMLFYAGMYGYLRMYIAIYILDACVYAVMLQL